MEACSVICKNATVALLDANPFIFEHINGIFVRFWPSGPPFSGISSTKSRFLCFFGLQNPHFRAFRAQNRGFCARLLNWMLGWGTFPPTEASSHLRSRCTCAAVAPAQPLHLRSRCICPAVVSAQPLCHLPSPVAAYRRCRRCCRCYRRCTCAAYTTADATAAALAEPSHLPSRRICAAAVPSPVACSRLPPVLPLLPLLPPLHLLSRFTCGAAAPAQPLCQLPLLAAASAQPILPQPTLVAPDGVCGLGYHSGLGG